jgi:hypothetical protein
VGKASRDKGLRNELAIVKSLRDAQLPAQRVPLSGASGGEFSGDVICCGLRIEAKVRKGGFREIYRWLEGNDCLVIKADRCNQLAVVPWPLFVELLKARQERENGERECKKESKPTE